MRISQAILSFFLPSACLSCRELLDLSESGPLCESCEMEIKPLPDSICEICGDPFPHPEIKTHQCGHCLTDPPPFEQARSVFKLNPVLTSMIHSYKYRGSPVALAWMIQKLSDFLEKNFPPLPYDLILPVPLHLIRLLHRGFNQSLFLARGLSKRFSIPLEFRQLRRRRFETSQARLGREERKAQIVGNFWVKDPHVFKDRRVLLVDDVYTTGATLKECAKVLKKCGARVNAITLARTPLHIP